MQVMPTICVEKAGRNEKRAWRIVLFCFGRSFTVNEASRLSNHGQPKDTQPAARKKGVAS